MKPTTLLAMGALTLGLSVAATSCQNEPSPACAQLETANKQLLANLKMYETTWNKIINQDQLEQINETNFAKTITLVASLENIVGIEGFKAYYKNYLTRFTDITFTIVEVFGQGNKIVKHWKFKGKHTGEFFGILATGKEVQVDGVTLVQMKDGKIAQEQDFLDNLEFMQQLGVIPRQ